MRTNIVHLGADKLRYEIREIVEIGNCIENLGTSVVWENIGDPIAKGEEVPQWIRDIVVAVVQKSNSYAYSPTQGLLATREYIACERNNEGGIQITSNDILFFNGLGDAITNIYANLHPQTRVIGPNPAYPTHSSAEAAHADSTHITYQLDPENEWIPDIADLEQKVKTNTDIAGIIIINPDNPTGFVYPKEILVKIVDIARKYNLFIISDEIYSNLVYERSDMNKLASVIGDVPGIAMRGISKEFPWPGARAGWVEFYNRSKDVEFDRFAKSLLNTKMLEVCSTTLPQQVIPQVMGDSRYYPYLQKRTVRYAKRSARAVAAFSELPELIVHGAHGAFYLTVVFKKGVLTQDQSLSISPESAELIAPRLKNATLDQRFVYYLLASTGVCVVPLSTGFNSQYEGFRITLLEPDEIKFDEVISIIVRAIRSYLDSSPLNT